MLDILAQEYRNRISGFGIVNIEIRSPAHTKRAALQRRITLTDRTYTTPPGKSLIRRSIEQNGQVITR